MNSGVLLVAGFVCPVCGTRAELSDARWVAPGDVLLLTCPLAHVTPWNVNVAPAASEVIPA
jgi:hypothetical protein